MAKRIPSIPHEWTEFLTCVLLHMLLPLLPVLIEVWLKGTLSEATAAITASMYSIAIGLSSQNKAMHSLSFVISIIFSVVFGVVSASQVPQLNGVTLWSVVSIISVFIIHFLERYNRHVVDCIPFWTFSQGTTK